MKKHGVVITGAAFLVLFLIFSFTAKEAMAASTGMVTVPILNVRSGPGTGHNKIGSIQNGQTYAVIEGQDGWYRLQIGQTTGWVSGEFLKVSSDSQDAASSVGQQSSPIGTVKVTADLLNVRQDPDISSKKIGGISMGETCQYFEKSGQWYKIKYGSTYGWIHGDYVVPVSQQDTNIIPEQPKEPEQPNQPAAPTIPQPPVASVSGQQPAEQGAGSDKKEGISAGDLVQVKLGLVSIRSNKILSSRVIGKAKKGSTYTVLESNSGWLKIEFGSKTGWIRESYVNVVENKDNDTNNTTAPNQPIQNGIYTIGSLKVYKTATRNTVAIPVTMRVDKSSSMTELYPYVNHAKTKAGKITITINNSTFSGTSSYISTSGNELVSYVDIMNSSKNINIININTKSDVDYEVSYVPAKTTQDNEYRYLKTYVVVNLKKSDTSTNTHNTGAVKNSLGKVKGNYLVTLDAGHGGEATGAANGGYNEKMMTLDIMNRVNNLLKAQGYDTYMTREKDEYVSLSDRADGANILKSDIFISVHLNSFTNNSANGTETLYDAQGKMPGTRLAELIQKHLVMSLNRQNRGIVSRPDLVVLNSTYMPSSLAEVLFISNTEELGLIKQESIRQKAAQAISDAVNEYFGFSH